MKKILLLFVGIVLLLNINLVFAQEHNFAEIKQLIDSDISCDKLTDEQLEAIGEYYMEQMHPGEAHELMDELMGGEGSEDLRQMHIMMGRNFYCGEDGMMGMMPMMMGGGNMMKSGGMMNMMGGQNMQDGMMQGMMGNWGYGAGYWNLFSLLYLILLIGLIIVVYLWIIKLWKNMKSNGRKK